jgi:diketogulonate reductase-like aldo/keto reductase
VIEERRLGPAVGLGTWATFDADAALAREVVGAALDVGCRVFDSSPMYGGAEASLAVALEGRRDTATVATKIWADSVEEGKRQFAAQLGWFGHVEIEQIHNLSAWEEQLPWLEEAREAGCVGRLGVTHYAEAAFGELARAMRTGRFQTVQLPYNPFQRECEQELLPLAAEFGIAVIVMRPLGGRSRELLDRGVDEAALAPFAEFGVSTWAQALLKWALSDERIDLVIPATSNPERVRENAAAGEGPWFGPAERQLVQRLAGA